MTELAKPGASLHFDQCVPPTSLPICARCNKRVDYLEVYMHPFSRMFRVTACCHGERESTDVSLFDLETMKSMEPGVAFKPKTQVEAATTT